MPADAQVCRAKLTLHRAGFETPARPNQRYTRACRPTLPVSSRDARRRCARRGGDPAPREESLQSFKRDLGATIPTRVGLTCADSRVEIDKATVPWSLDNATAKVDRSIGAGDDSYCGLERQALGAPDWWEQLVPSGLKRPLDARRWRLDCDSDQQLVVAHATSEGSRASIGLTCGCAAAVRIVAAAGPPLPLPFIIARRSSSRFRSDGWLHQPSSGGASMDALGSVYSIRLPMPHWLDA